MGIHFFESKSKTVSLQQTIAQPLHRAIQTTASRLMPAAYPLQSRIGHRIDSPFALMLYFGAALVAGLILFVPVYLLLQMIQGWEAAAATIIKPATLNVLGNSLILAGSVTAGATAIAVPLAWLTTLTDLPGRKMWSVLAALPLVMPSYIFAYLFISFLSPKGLLQGLLEPLFGVEKLPSVYGFSGAFVVLTLVTFPYVFLTVRACLQQLNPAIIEAAEDLGASRWQIFRRIIFPVIRPSMAAGGLLVTLYTLRDFGAVTLLQYSTFTRVIYNRFQGYRLDEAASLAIMLVILTMVILYFESRTRGQTNLSNEDMEVMRPHKRLTLGRWRWPALTFAASVVFISLILPIILLTFWVIRGLQQDWLVADPSVIQQNTGALLPLLEPTFNSLFAAGGAAFLAMAMAIPIAILVVRKPGRLSAFFEKLTYASYALPGIVVALAYVFAGLNFAQPFYQTMPLLLVVYVVLFIPQAIGTQRTTLLKIPQTFAEAAQGLGATPLQVFRRITLPLMRPGITAGGLLVFLTVIKELPATLILSPLGFNTLSASIWTHINEAFFAKAAVPTLILLLISSLPLAWSSWRSAQETT